MLCTNKMLDKTTEIERTRTARNEKLDLVRGVSALLVLIAHVRSLVLVDFVQIENASIFMKMGYFLTGIHHQAVIVFFILSGFFVGGSVLQAVRRGRFSWKRYASARLTRLWIVLFPALVLTCVLDLWGQRLAPEVYAGECYRAFQSGPSESQPISLGLGTFLGNLVFLQTIVVRPYGTNGPLWSLANEFWYYVLFPLVVMSGSLCFGATRYRWYSVIGIVLSAALVWWLPPAILLPSPIWLFGVIVWIVSQNDAAMRVMQHWSWNFCFGMLFLGSLASSKTSSLAGTDFVVGLSFACWVPSLLGPWARQGWCQWISLASSEISYTLYVTHFPLSFLLAASWFRGRQSFPDVVGCSLFMAIVTSALAVAWMMWFLFESNTERVRHLLEARSFSKQATT